MNAFPITNAAKAPWRRERSRSLTNRQQLGEANRKCQAQELIPPPRAFNSLSEVSSLCLPDHFESLPDNVFGSIHWAAV